MATAKELAAHLGLSTRRICDLVAAGIIGRNSAGGYDLDPCRLRYIEHLRAQLASRTDAGDARLKAARAEIAEMEAARMRGELAPIADTMNTLEGVCGLFKTNLLAMPSRVAPRLVGKTAPQARAILDDEVYDLLERLSETEVVQGPEICEGGGPP